MQIEGAVALVTGANRGIGKAFADALVEYGAAKVYAGARDPRTISDPRLTPLRLDVTDAEQVAAAAEQASDVTIVVNNAGVGGDTQLFEGSFDGARYELEVNYLGTWAVSRAFAPVLARNGGGALVNMLSVASWASMALAPGYAASKSAQWSLTNALRAALREQGTLVAGVHVGFVDTDLTERFDAPKIPAAVVAAETMRGLLADAEEILVDDFTRAVKAGLAGAPAVI